MKRVMYILMVAVMLAAILPSRTEAIPTVRLIIDNHEISGLDTPPLILQNRVMVPARAVFERVGGVVDWNETSRQITVHLGGDTLHMTVGQTQAQINGNAISMEVPPVILGGRTLIPLRFPAEAFGFDVAWDHVGRAAILHSPLGEREQNTHLVDLASPQSPQNDPTLARDVSTAPIVSIPHPGTTITDIISPRASDADAFAIVASSAITDVNHFLLPDNRLVVDIYNAVSELRGLFGTSGTVRQIRASQFSSAPNITRVVFDLVDIVEYSVTLSYDRRTITVAFAVNNITSVTATAGTVTDTLIIRGDFQPSVRLSTAGYPEYMTVYIDNARMTAYGTDIVNGNFGTSFTTGRGADGVAYIRIYMQAGRWPSISLSHGSNQVSVMMHDGLNGVRYDFATRELRICKDAMTFDLNRVRINEEYLINRYTFTLPVNGLGGGSLHIGDGYINSINIRQNSAGNIEITFETARVMAFTLREERDEYVIRANLPREVYDFIVVIDPGHGGRDPGASHHGVAEKDVVLAISHFVMEHLNRNPNIRAYMTRHTDVTVANTWRTAFANQMADLYVSVHANAVSNRSTVTGIETWYSGHAREENFSFTSRQLARMIQYRMITATGAIDRGIKRNTTWIVLRDTHMPSVLLEVGFLSNREEAARLNSSSHQRVLAQAIYNGIVDASNSFTPRR